MSLYQQKNRPEATKIDPALKALIVHAFLEEVQAYAGQKITEKEAVLKEVKTLTSQKSKALLARKLQQWQDYAAFNRIAIEEIEDGTLDAWFERLLK